MKCTLCSSLEDLSTSYFCAKLAETAVFHAVFKPQTFTNGIPLIFSLTSRKNATK